MAEGLDFDEERPMDLADLADLAVLAVLDGGVVVDMPAIEASPKSRRRAKQATADDFEVLQAEATDEANAVRTVFKVTDLNGNRIIGYFSGSEANVREWLGFLHPGRQLTYFPLEVVAVTGAIVREVRSAQKKAADAAARLAALKGETVKGNEDGTTG